jgi:hypothetical protein
MGLLSKLLGPQTRGLKQKAKEWAKTFEDLRNSIFD